MSDLSGVWQGSYAYPDQLQPVPFTIELRDHGGRLSGEVSEPAPPHLSAGEVQAIVTGRRSGSRVTFTKIYDALDHFQHPVDYVGEVDEEECEVAGKWAISPGWSGSFVMTRPKPAREEIEEKEGARVGR